MLGRAIVGAAQLVSGLPVSGLHCQHQCCNVSTVKSSFVVQELNALGTCDCIMHLKYANLC